MPEDPTGDCAGVQLSPTLQQHLDDAARDWARSSDYVDRVDGYLRQAILANARAQDEEVAAELVGEAHERLLHDPVLSARVKAVRAILLADDRTTGRVYRHGQVSGAEQFAAALALIVAEKMPLPSATHGGATEAAAHELWNRIGRPQAGDKSWLQLAIEGRTGTQDRYRILARRVLAAATRAGYRLHSGDQEIPDE